MESSIKPVKDDLAPKSTESSIIPISSIYIELKIPKEKNETESCQHNFSILGYAAEMRRKNPTASMPFDTQKKLPPLPVPNFRWWRCSQCRSTLTGEAVTGDNKESTGQVNEYGNSEIPREFQQSADVKHNSAYAKQRTKPMPSEVGDSHTGALFRSFRTSSAAATDNHSKNSWSPQVLETEQLEVLETALLISKFKSSQLKFGPDLSSLNCIAEKIDSSREKKKVSTSRSFPEKDDLHFGPCSFLPVSEPDLLLTKSQLLDSEKTSAVQGHRGEINRQCGQMACNFTAQESSDDIPKDIIEFMAQLQYQRGIAEAGRNEKTQP